MFEGEIAQLADPETLYRRPEQPPCGGFHRHDELPAARIVSEGGGKVEVEALGLERCRLMPPVHGHGFGPRVKHRVRPETLTILFEGQQPQDRESMATVEEVVYYGDMTYYDVRLDGTDTPIRISMRHVFGRPVLDIKTRARVGVEPGRPRAVPLGVARQKAQTPAGRLPIPASSSPRA